MNAGAARDSATNPSQAAVLEVTADLTPPTVTLTTDPPGLDEVNEPFTVNFEFDEAVFGFMVGDIGVEHASLSAFNGSDGDQSYSVRVTPNNEGAVTVTVPADAARDAAGNANEEADLSFEESLSAYIEREHIMEHENDFPWLRQAWRNHEPPVTAIVRRRLRGQWNHEFFKFRTIQTPWRTRDSADVLARQEYSSEAVVVREVSMLSFTSSPIISPWITGSADLPGPVGVGWLYAIQPIGGSRPCL